MTILAIDQGASKTSVLLVSEDGRILGTGNSEGACHFTMGLKKAMDTIVAATAEALAQAGLSMGDISSVFGGLSGANWPDEIEMLEKELKKIFNVAQAKVWNDCVVALRAGTDADNAIVLCSGSGMNSAIFLDGKLRTVYNNYIEQMDQGGEALGGRVFKAVFQSHMQVIKPTSLTKRVMEYFEYENMDSLLLAYQRNQLEKPLKDLSILLFEEADRDDSAALEIIYSYGKSVSKYVKAAVRRYGIDSGNFTVVLSGGVFKAKNPLLLESVCTHIHREYSKLEIRQAKYEPVVGAALLALDQLGAKADGAHALCKQLAEEKGLTRF